MSSHDYTPSEFIREIEQVPTQYLPQLFQIVHIYKESIIRKNLVDSFEKSWDQALKKEISPITELWENIDAR
jgi:hypothetical protein